MKKLSFEQMEVVNGGEWHYTWRQHLGCALVGIVSGGGVLGVVGYGACLLLEY